ncbi:hypothetical protein [Siphonobacter sp. SORGH_AS_1065]|uniref:hypothetical protein n=1 Tax=Siphonobacter sp. SORGH_AS_1065 TaxID=3041795 RepID=UPI0027D7EB74|nr:hypothetical protein [Siphonobacter sp. SORGH_AS_1065]
MSHSLSILATYQNKETTFPIDARHLSHLLALIEQEQKQLAQLNERFSRQTINIGVVGRARQGKSRLLQSISGLANSFIPDGDGSHCTGTVSRMVNRPNQTTADVHFYSRKAFFEEVILPYYQALALGPIPANLAEFSSHPLPDLSVETDSIAIARYKKLQTLHQNFSRYSQLLTGLTQTIPLKQIRRYVAQVTENREPLYAYLAVQEVIIETAFPAQEVGAIQLIDMPGLGDTGLVNEEELLKNLVTQVDFILYVRKPDSLGAVWEPADLHLYQLCQEAVSNRTNVSMVECSYLILNHTRSPALKDNLKNCQDLLISSTRNGLEFAQSFVVDCSDQQQVQGKVMEEILLAMGEELDTWDEQDQQAYQHRINSLSQQITKLLDDFNSIIHTPMDTRDFPIFKKLFNAVWLELTNACEENLKQLEALREMPNQQIQERFLSIKEECLDQVAKLTVREIELTRNTLGSYNRTYEEYLNEYRTFITQSFLKLGETLNQVLQQVKQDVFTILKNEGKLAGLLSIQNPEEIFEQKLLQEINNLESLAIPLNSFIHFELSYLGFLHFRIREHLDTLTPDYISLRLSREDTTEDILTYITSSVEACLYKIQHEFDNWAQDLNKMAFALVEELVDQLLRAKDAKDNWEIFYQQYRKQLWKEVYKELENN